MRSSTIYPGRKILIPGIKEEKFVKPSLGKSKYFSKRTKLSAIAKKYNLEKEYLRLSNGLSRWTQSVKKETLFIPGGESGSTRTKSTVTKKSSKTKSRKTSSNKTITKKSTSKKKSSTVLTKAKKKLTKAKNYLPKKKVKKPGFKLSMPLKGTITSTFRSKKRPDHCGLDIYAPIGTPVKAAAAGTVVYSDNWLSGYGNMVILEHPGNFFTIYSHHKKNAVKKGKKVKRGSIVGYVGMTGRATGPHLHFEFRYKDIPIDPQKYLK